MTSEDAASVAWDDWSKTVHRWDKPDRGAFIDGFNRGRTSMTTPLLPVNVQRDEDAALGAAWRRCEVAAIPRGQRFGGVIQRSRSNDRWQAVAFSFDAQEVDTQALTIETSTYPTPTQALEALADALESRRE